MDKLEYTDLNDDFIDITPKQKRGGRWIKWAVLAVVLTVLVLANGVGIYTDSIWFGSLGFSSRYWYVFGLGWGLFAMFAVLTVAIVRGGLYLLERVFGPEIFKPRRIVINKQPLDLSFARFLRPAGWVLAIIVGIIYGLGLSSDWNAWVLYLHQPVTAATDPIFNRPVGF